MTNTSKCVACGNETLPMLHNGNIAQYKLRHVKPELPPFSVYVCTKCGHWQIFSLMLREQPKKVPKDQIPEQAKRDLRLK